MSKAFGFGGRLCTYHDSVIDGEDGQFVESCDEIPTSSDISSDKDSKRKD